MAPTHGRYQAVAETWEFTNDWNNRSTFVHPTHLQPPRLSQDVWDSGMVHDGVPKYALDESHLLSRPERRGIHWWDESRSYGRDGTAEKQGRDYNGDRTYKGEYKQYVPSRQDYTVKHIERNAPWQKEHRSILKHKDNRIFFDDAMGPYHGFGISSDHPIVYDRFKFPTAEHLFFFIKFAEWPEISRHLRKQPTVTKLRQAAEAFSNVKLLFSKQEKLHYMEVVLWHKFTQHKTLKKVLLETGERSIIFVSPIDSFWGAGRDSHGKNYLGKALEKTRWRIRTCTPPVQTR